MTEPVDEFRYVTPTEPEQRYIVAHNNFSLDQWHDEALQAMLRARMKEYAAEFAAENGYELTGHEFLATVYIRQFFEDGDYQEEVCIAESADAVKVMAKFEAKPKEPR